MDYRKKPAFASSSTGNAASASSNSSQSSNLSQPARVLIVEALPPLWLEMCNVLCEALDNFFSLVSNLDGPCRIPLFSMYAISRRQACLLPFMQLRGSMARLHTCVEELRSLPVEGCIRGGDLLPQTVLNSLQQFRQYIRYTNLQTRDNLSLEITVLTGQPGLDAVQKLELGLKDADLASLKRLLVVQLHSEGHLGQELVYPEIPRPNNEDALTLGPEVELHHTENNLKALEMMFKMWLHEQGGDRDQLHLLLPRSPNNPAGVCIKCDIQERLINPALISSTSNPGPETSQDRGRLNFGQSPQTLSAIKIVQADGVCQSVLYGLPLVIRPTNCWRLGWDELEKNHKLFHALCHALWSRDMFLLMEMQMQPPLTFQGENSALYCHYVLQPSAFLSLLLKPVVSRELLLPCLLPLSPLDPAPDAMTSLQDSLSQLNVDFMLNPLTLDTSLYQHLRARSLLPQARYPYRRQTSGAQASRQPRQPQNQGRQSGARRKARATVAPLPSTSSSSSFSGSSSSLMPPPARPSRPALSFLNSNSSSQSPILIEDTEDENAGVPQ